MFIYILTNFLCNKTFKKYTLNSGVMESFCQLLNLYIEKTLAWLVGCNGCISIILCVNGYV